ncbi:response regulator transcription factor [Roseivivax sp. GX 12232]|uniref:response regulator transcription factor n=1 Tax=Roseivivax sp. GX 12232 TaxID=2900547 RepID=UPI001E42CD26|nr:response regulator transcription factor [Roseivivax sp. GX 12232]MCE0506953.1 response regulator transcription factor [Roseivivax sp. GX 12232]
MQAPTTDTAVRILVIDTSLILATTLAERLDALPDCSAEAHVGQKALPPRGMGQGPDMVICDPAHCGQSPDRLRAALTEQLGPHETLAFLPPSAASTAAACLEAGYSGVIARSESLEHFASAVESVLLGGIYVDGAFGDPGAPTEALTLSGTGDLTAREREVLVEVARGQSCKHIGRLFSISARTVETHKYRAMEKLGLANRSSLHSFAMQNAWF